MIGWKKPARAIALLFVMISVLLGAAPLRAGTVPDAIPVPGCVVLQLRHANSMPQQAGEPGAWKTGDSLLNQWLDTIGAQSLKQEYGRLLPDYRVLRYDPKVATERVVERLKLSRDVINAWGNVAFPVSEWTYQPNDPSLPSQWHHTAIHSRRAWAISLGNPDVIVGIVDTGVDYTHPDLANSMWINPGEDLNGDGLWTVEDEDGEDNDENGYVDDGIGWDWVNTSADGVYNGEDPAPPDNDPMDFQGHGTHCSGDAAATTDNGVGVAAPGAGCRIGALRAGWAQPDGLGVVGLSEASSAVDYALEMGFSVLSMSFGGAGSDPQFFYASMQAATDAGMIICAAAGNESTTQRSFPAAESFVIAVAATTPSGHLANFSNRGDWVAISAPGVFITSTMRGGGYGAESGTSMACPITAGSMAQLLSLAPDWENWRYLDRLTFTAQPMTDTGAGAGLLDLAKMLDAFVSVDSVAAESPAGPRLVHDAPCTLHLRWWKQDGVATDVSMVVSSSNNRITFDEDSLYIGNVSAGDMGVWDLPLTIGGNGSAQEQIIIDCRFRGTDLFSAPFDVTQKLHLQVGASDVLFVDADEGASDVIWPWYTAPLNQIGLSMDVVNLDDITDLAGTMQGYSAVILATGSRESSPLRPGDLDAYNQYLADGGRWLVTGQNIAQALNDSDPTVLTDRFHISFTAPHANRLTARGLEGGFASGMSFTLAGSGGAWNQTSVDVLAAQEGAQPLLAYTLDTPEELAGVRVPAGDGDIVFCGFGLEAINDSLGSSNSRADFFYALFNAWGFTLDAPETGASDSPARFSLGNLWPNPTNGTVTLPFTLPSSGEVKIRVVNRIGREVAAWSQRGSAGANRIAWQMPAGLASGVYMVTLNSQGLSATRRVTLVK